jgi:hypothetical protein
MNVTQISRFTQRQMRAPAVTLQKSGALNINHAALEDMGMTRAKFGVIDTDVATKEIKIRFQTEMKDHRAIKMMKTRPGPDSGIRFNITKSLSRLGIKLHFSRVMSYEFDGDTLTLDMKRLSK